MVVTDSATSNGVTAFIEQRLGGRHLRYKKGYRFVIEKGRSIEGCVAAVECSGHGAWRDNGWLDDGCYTAVKLISELALMRRVGTGRLSDLLDGLSEPAESVELRFRAAGGPAAMPGATAAALLALRAVADAHPGAWSVEEVNYEGLRVNFDPPEAGTGTGTGAREGWVMLRPSLHEPILSMQIECDRVGGAAHAAHLLWHGGFRDLGALLDLAPLQKLVSSPPRST